MARPMQLIEVETRERWTRKERARSRKGVEVI